MRGVAAQQCTGVNDYRGAKKEQTGAGGNAIRMLLIVGILDARGGSTSRQSIFRRWWVIGDGCERSVCAAEYTGEAEQIDRCRH